MCLIWLSVSFSYLLNKISDHQKSICFSVSTMLGNNCFSNYCPKRQLPSSCM